MHYRAFIGQPLLLPTLLVDISLTRSMKRSLKTKSGLDYIEDATQQHTWAEFIANSYDASPKDITFEELMRLAHGSKIEVAVAQRKARVFLDVIKLLRDTYAECHDTPRSGPKCSTPNSQEIKEWINFLDSKARMESTDADFLMRRAETQISAVCTTAAKPLYRLSRARG
jgi:hypothetical protein